MTMLMTLLIAAVAVYIGKELLSASQKKQELRPIRIKTEEQRPKNRR